MRRKKSGLKPRPLQVERLESRRLMALDLWNAAFGIADGSRSHSNSGLFAVADLNQQTLSPRGNPFFGSDSGFSGLLVDSRQRMFGTTIDENALISELVELDPLLGTLLNRVPVTANGQPISVGDLAYNARSGQAFAVRSSDDGGGQEGSLYQLDLTTGVATSLGPTGLGGNVAIGFHGALLYATSFDTASGNARLHTLNSSDGSVLTTTILSNPVGQFGIVEGLADGLVGGRLVASDRAIGELVSIDPQNGQRARLALSGPSLGAAGDVTFLEPGLSGEVIYAEDFENGDGGFSADNTGRRLPGLWHLSVGRSDDGLAAHSRVQSFYYGAFEGAQGGGHYVFPYDHQGVLVSPPITLPDCGVLQLSFNYLLETRERLDVDFVEVSIDDGTSITKIYSRQDGSLPQTGRTEWLTAIKDISQFAGKTIELRFLFDTGPSPQIDPEGWYVDDILITHVPTADLQVTKAIDDTSPNEGQEITYTLTASNEDDCTTATGVTLMDVLPTGVEFRSASSGGTFAGGIVSWPEFALGANESRVFTIVGVVKPGTSGSSLANVGRISGDVVDPDSSNNEVTQTSTVNRVDLSITKSVDDNTPNVGQPFLYTLIVTNALTSNNTATGVTVQDTLPSGVQLNPAVSPAPTGFNVSNGVVTWTNLTISPGQSLTLTIPVIVLADTSGTSLENVATVDGLETDPDRSNNRTTQTSLVNRVDLSVSKDFQPANPLPGSDVTFTILVRNSSSSNAAATNVVVKDLLSTGLTFTSANAPIPTVVGNELTWNLPSIPIGGTVTLAYTATVNTGVCSDQSNQVTAIANETDPNLQDNTMGREIPVHCADLRVVKTVDKPSPKPNDLVTFTITVANLPTSNSSVSGVRVTDDLGPDLEFLAASKNGTYDATTKVVTWANQSIIKGGVETFSVTALVRPSAAGKMLEDIAAVTGPQFDPDPNNNTVRERIAVGDTIQFIAPLSIYRLNGPFTPPASGVDITPLAGLGTIAGAYFHDLNQNGTRDLDEVVRPGWRFYLDQNGDNVFDPQAERSTVTDGLGRFAFRDLAPGSYTIRLDGSQLSQGTFASHTPSPNDTRQIVGDEQRGLGEHLVTLSADQQVDATFGSFEFSPLIRPADEFIPRLNGELQTALVPWQQFEIANTTDRPFSLTSIDLGDSLVVGTSAREKFVSLKRVVNGALQDVATGVLTSPLSISPSERVTFLAMYDPAIRSSSGVVRQYPEWLPNRKTPVHTFATDDRIFIGTDANRSFEISLRGGSTYDSDIVYDGSVTTVDFARLRALLPNGVPITSDQPGFDPTSDINAKCQDGADQVLNSCSWPIASTNPRREIGLGDYGPLSTEVRANAARAPLLDLDSRATSLHTGFDAAIRTSGSEVAITSGRASFVNLRAKAVADMTVAVRGSNVGTLHLDLSGQTEISRSGDVISFSRSGVSARVEVIGEGTVLLRMQALPSSSASFGRAADLTDFEILLNRLIRFRSNSANTNPHLVELDIVATGQVTGSADGFSTVNSTDELRGNQATSRILVTP